MSDPIPDFTIRSQMLANSLRVLNVIDALSTVHLVRFLGVQESNPITAWMLEVSPFLFVFVKILGVGLCASFLASRGRWKTLAFANFVYVAALAMHASILI